MHEFQWVISDFLLRHLQVELIVTLAVLLAVLVATGILVRSELKAKHSDDHEDS